MQYTYYPGCSLEGTAKDYAQSIQGICRALEIELDEIPDWTCCGATSAHSIDHQASIALAARTLNQAAAMPHSKMLVPCPMCFNRLKTASHLLKGDQQNHYPVTLTDSVPAVWDLANLFATDPVQEEMIQKIQKPLKGLKVVCYYGCMANRPPEITEAADHENPQALDRIVTNLGGTAIPWPYKTDCCGASQAVSLEPVATQLVAKLFDMARRVGAQGVVVSCQMCQANLDMYDDRAGHGEGLPEALPVYYFTELIGLALGLKDAQKWLAHHLTDPFLLLRELKIIE
jgi:heterodisulfide reductase subunit B